MDLHSSDLFHLSSFLFPPPYSSLLSNSRNLKGEMDWQLSLYWLFFYHMLLAPPNWEILIFVKIFVHPFLPKPSSWGPWFWNEWNVCNTIYDIYINVQFLQMLTCTWSSRREDQWEISCLPLWSCNLSHILAGWWVKIIICVGTMTMMMKIDVEKKKRSSNLHLSLYW